MKSEETKIDESDIFQRYYKFIKFSRDNLLQDELGLVERIETETNEFFSKYKDVKVSEKDISNFRISLMNVYQKAFQKKHQFLNETEKRLERIRREYPQSQ